TVLVWILAKAPENRTQTVGFAVVEAVAAALRGLGAPGQVSLSPKGLYPLLQNFLGLENVALVCRRGRRVCPGRGTRLRWRVGTGGPLSHRQGGQQHKRNHISHSLHD